MGKVTFYIRVCDEPIWEQFQKICDANGWKYGEKIMELAIRPTVAVHSGGGSQTFLEFADKPLCMPIWKTCLRSHKTIDGGRFFCGKAYMWLEPELCAMRDKNSKCYVLDQKLMEASKHES